MLTTQATQKQLQHGGINANDESGGANRQMRPTRSQGSGVSRVLQCCARPHRISGYFVTDNSGEFCMFSFGYFPAVRLSFADVSEPSVNYVSHTVLENLKQFAFKGDKSRVVLRTF
jgi:hypothetical protein